MDLATPRLLAPCPFGQFVAKQDRDFPNRCEAPPAEAGFLAYLAEQCVLKVLADLDAALHELPGARDVASLEREHSPVRPADDCADAETKTFGFRHVSRKFYLADHRRASRFRFAPQRAQ